MNCNGKIEWEQQGIEVALDVDLNNKSGCTKAKNYLKQFVKALTNWDLEMKSYASKKLLKQAIEWAENGLISEKDIRDRIQLVSISMTSGGGFTVVYDDNMAYAYVLDNGSGDSLIVMFTENGVLIKGFDHENELNQFAADEWDNAFFEHIYAELPEEFAELLDEDDRDNTTFCMWCMDDTDIWTQNETEGNDGGKSFLLRYIHKTPEEWSDWAKYYYETEIAQEVVQKVYNEKDLTEEDVMKLNPGRDAKEVFAELGETF